MEFIVNSFKRFLDHHEIFYMHEIDMDGKKFIDMVIDDNDLRDELLSLTYNLNTDESIEECSKHNFDTSSRLAKCVAKSDGRGDTCIRLVLDEYYACKINKVGHVILSHPILKH